MFLKEAVAPAVVEVQQNPGDYFRALSALAAFNTLAFFYQRALAATVLIGPTPSAHSAFRNWAVLSQLIDSVVAKTPTALRLVSVNQTLMIADQQKRMSDFTALLTTSLGEWGSKLGDPGEGRTAGVQDR